MNIQRITNSTADRPVSMSASQDVVGRRVNHRIAASAHLYYYVATPKAILHVQLNPDKVRAPNGALSGSSPPFIVSREA